LPAFKNKNLRDPGPQALESLTSARAVFKFLFPKVWVYKQSNWTMSKWDDPSKIIHLKSSAMGWFSQSIFHWRTVGTGLGRTGQGVVKKKTLW